MMMMMTNMIIKMVNECGDIYFAHNYDGAMSISVSNCLQKVPFVSDTTYYSILYFCNSLQKRGIFKNKLFADVGDSDLCVSVSG